MAPEETITELAGCIIHDNGCRRVVSPGFVHVSEIFPGVQALSELPCETGCERVEAVSTMMHAPGKRYDGDSAPEFYEFICQMCSRYPGSMEEVIRRIRGRPLIDIGAGCNDAGYRIAEKLGASAYIALEPFNCRVLFQVLSGNELRLPVAVVAADGLTGLGALPYEAGSVFASAMDGSIITSDAYGACLNALIPQVVHREGACIVNGVCSVIEPPFMDVLTSGLCWKAFVCP